MQRHIEFSEGEYYHVYNRGVEKRDIFLTSSDYERFIALLYLCNNQRSVDFRALKQQGRTFEQLFLIERGTPLVAIGAYCLMPNHFHLLVKEITLGGISEFMRKVMTGYTMYFNKLNKRVGPLFQGAFKAEHADNDEYLKYLYSYIHLNPVKLIDAGWSEHRVSDKKKAEKFLQEYPHSSYREYASATEARAQAKILDKQDFPEYFEHAGSFSEIQLEWLNFDEGTTFVRGVGNHN